MCFVTPCINTNFQQVFKCLPWYSDTHKEVNNPEKCPWKEPSWHRHHQLLCKIQWKCCQASKLAILLNDAKKMWWVVWKIFLGSKSLPACGLLASYVKSASLIAVSDMLNCGVVFGTGAIMLNFFEWGKFKHFWGIEKFGCHFIL